VPEVSASSPGESREKVRRLRLFFALWPDAPMRAALHAAASGMGDTGGGARPVPQADWHLTLAFVGAVAASSLESVCGVAGEVARARASAGAQVEVRIDRLDFWPKAQILCARVSSPAAEALAQSLREALVTAGFAPDLKPFRAHVTLVRKVARAPFARALPEVTWTFREFALVESRSGPSGSLYSLLASWSLDGA